MTAATGRVTMGAGQAIGTGDRRVTIPMTDAHRRSTQKARRWFRAVSRTLRFGHFGEAVQAGSPHYSAVNQIDSEILLGKKNKIQKFGI